MGGGEEPMHMLHLLCLIYGVTFEVTVLANVGRRRILYSNRMRSNNDTISQFTYAIAVPPTYN